MDLRENFQVTKICTQGRQDSAQWVTHYKVFYSTDGKIFTSNDEVGRCKRRKIMFYYVRCVTLEITGNDFLFSLHYFTIMYVLPTVLRYFGWVM